MLAARTIPSPVGQLTLVASPVGLRAILWDVDWVANARVGTCDTEDGADGTAEQHLDDAERQLGEYFAGSRSEFDLVLDPVGTEFQRRAWTVLRGIPFGETISYGEQARRLGDPKASRAVGTANGRNPLSIVVPCHRVVGADGRLTGFGGGLSAKAWLLDHELALRASTLPCS
jgi:methylated-DNA-[protein]-cysteine S-methyltransferase